MELNLDDFQASQGWLQSWLKREGLSWSLLCGEGGSVSQEVVDDYSRRIPLITEGYKPEDIFNMDESGLFYRTLPHRSYILKGTKCHGRKKGKDRITVVFCVSATGEQIMPWIIGRSAKPKALSGIEPHELNVISKSNKKAWMTGKEFKEFVNALNNKMTAQNRKILLIIDNAPGHPKLEVSNVKLHFLPPNTTSRLQPLDGGIIKQIKSVYKKALVRYIRARLSECATAYELLTTIDIHNAIQWVTTAWMQVSAETIKKCWKNCGFSFDEYGDIADTDIPEIPEPPEFQELDIDGTWEDMLGMDADVETSCPVTQENEQPAEEPSTSVKEEDSEKEDHDSDNEEMQPVAILPNMREKLLLLKDYRQIACEVSNTKMLQLVKHAGSYGRNDYDTQKYKTTIKDYFIKQEPVKGMSVSYE